MSKIVAKFLFSLLLCFVSIEYVKADVIWPTLVISKGMTSLPSIIIGLIIEILYIKEYMQFDWVKSSYVGVFLNTISGLVGYWIIILGGGLVALTISIFTFFLPNYISNSLMELVSFIFCIVVNVVIEGATLKLCFKKTFHETYKWLIYANVLSVSVAIAYLAFVRHTLTV